jgi:6-phosphofructo-2-kinase
MNSPRGAEILGQDPLVTNDAAAASTPSTLEIPGLTSSRLSPSGYIAPQDVGAKLAIIMVGLPARGKSYIVKKLARYLNWLQHRTRIFNVGERRRKIAQSKLGGEASESPPTTPSSLSSARFFDPTDPNMVSLRDQIALGTLDELLDWLLRDGGSIGILDATNSTLQRRQLVLFRIRQRAGPQLGVLFLESCCYETELLETNFRLKLAGPDYKGQIPAQALADFCQRVAHYERSYVPLGVAEEEQGIPYVQMIDVGRKINTHLIQGFLSTQVVDYLLNFNLSERQIWISCNGGSFDDATGKIGRNSNLNDNGWRYARALARFIQKQREDWEKMRRQRVASGRTWPLGKISTSSRTSNNRSRPPVSSRDSRPRNICIWTSMMPQAIQTAEPFPEDLYIKKQMKMLDDLNAGTMAGLSFDEIAVLHPAEFAARKRDKLLYRWPGLGGKGYVDVINRLRPVIMELERIQDHLLFVTHRAVVRVLLAYFLGLERDDLADMVIPKDSVFCLEPVCIIHNLSL